LIRSYTSDRTDPAGLSLTVRTAVYAVLFSVLMTYVSVNVRRSPPSFACLAVLVAVQPSRCTTSLEESLWHGADRGARPVGCCPRLAAVVLLVVLGSIIIYQYIDEKERQGGTLRMNWLAILIYDLLGKWGVTLLAVVVGVSVCIAAVLEFRKSRRTA
jgi:hypothetical protein